VRWPWVVLRLYFDVNQDPFFPTILEENFDQIVGVPKADHRVLDGSLQLRVEGSIRNPDFTTPSSRS
jgi:hypothetical protein